jgi:hypothetical protein
VKGSYTGQFLKPLLAAPARGTPAKTGATKSAPAKGASRKRA